MSRKREDSWEARMARKAKTNRAIHESINRRARKQSSTPALDLAEDPTLAPYRPSLEQLVDEAVREVGRSFADSRDVWVDIESIPRIVERIAATGYFAPYAGGPTA